VAPIQEIDYVLNDCFLAVGQAIGTRKSLDPEAIAWWRERYRAAFLTAMIRRGNSWERDRHRVTAVGRFLGERALFHAGSRPSVDLESAQRASAEVDSGCRMNAIREGVESLRAQYPSDRTVTHIVQTDTTIQ
jgi:hypothetical protein